VMRVLPVLSRKSAVVVLVLYIVTSGCIPRPQYSLENQLTVEKVRLGPFTTQANVDATFSFRVQHDPNRGASLTAESVDVRSVSVSPFSVDGSIDLSAEIKVQNDWDRDFTITIRNIVIEATYSDGQHQIVPARAVGSTTIPTGSSGLIKIAAEGVPFRYGYDPETETLVPQIQLQVQVRYTARSHVLKVLPVWVNRTYKKQINLVPVPLKKEQLVAMGSLLGRTVELPELQVDKFIDIEGVLRRMLENGAAGEGRNR